MTNEPSCWICRRTLNEVANDLKGKSKAELEIENTIEKIETEKQGFAAEINPLMQQIPKEYSNFEYSFVVANPDQFKLVSFLAKLKKLEQLILSEITELKHSALIRTEIHFGEILINNQNKSQLLKAIKDFELKENREIGELVDTGFRGSVYPNSAMFKGLKFEEGISYLHRLGVFYFDQQLEMLNREMPLAASKALWKLDRVRFEDGEMELWVCAVCERIIAKFAAY